MTKTPAPAEVLPRFLAIADALHESGSWFEDWTVLRHCALALPLVEGEPDDLARRMRETIADLRRGAPWWSTLSGATRAFAATSLIQHGEGASGFHEELKRVRKLFRESKLPRGGTSEVLGFLVLREGQPGERIDAALVRRMGELYRAIKQDHPWLLGVGEYPTLALLATSEQPIGEIARRVEAILQGLEQRGFRSRGRLIPIAQLLFFAPTADESACAKFEALWKEFQEQGLRMLANDYDELGLLCFAPRTPREIVRCVLAHREQISELKPRPGREISFSLACSTAFLELVGGDPKLRKFSKAQAALQVRSIIAARQAAAAGAASAG